MRYGTGWVVVFCLGIILGFLTLGRWPPYYQYTPIAVTEWALHCFAVLAGIAAALFAEEGPAGLISVAVMVVLAVSIPVIATAVTASMLGITDLVDIALYSAIQRALTRSISLFVFTTVGLALGIVVRPRIM